MVQDMSSGMNGRIDIPPGMGNPLPFPDFGRTQDMQGEEEDMGDASPGEMGGEDAHQDLDMPDLEQRDLSMMDMAHTPDMSRPDPPAQGCTPLPIADTITTSLTDLQNSYMQTAWEATAVEMMRRRYTQGYNSLQVGAANDAACLRTYESVLNTSTMSHLALDMGLVVRGCLRLFVGWDAVTRTQQLFYFDPATSALLVGQFEVPAPFPERGVIVNYLPSELMTETAVMNYLTRPTDRQASMGAIFEVFQLSLEELLSSYVLRDVLTMDYAFGRREEVRMHQLFTLIYLYHLRTTQPADYHTLLQHRPWLEHIAWVWARSEFALDAAANVPGLGIGKEMPILNAIQDPRWRDEISSLRQALGCR